ncbi:hypothetical protein R84981_002813 [Carnimonas sp. R-84981]|uniref:Gp138 family membrane-puncturing spike protein n=1 Tax=Carnimonas bestiolae TaxID=3402172 RepID=UPI003EDBA7DB
MAVDLRSQMGGDAQEASDQRKDAGWATRTSSPGIVQSFHADRCTVDVQIAAQGIALDDQSNDTDEVLPMLVDVPVVFPRGGGVSLTFPIRTGDECLIVFSDRCLDFWHQSGGVQKSASQRNHDLSDAFVIPGPYSDRHVPRAVSVSAVQLRTNDGRSFIQIEPAGNVTVTSPQTTVNGPATINGDLTINGRVAATGDVTAGAISLETHVHAGVTSGDGETGTPQ